MYIYNWKIEKLKSYLQGVVVFYEQPGDELPHLVYPGKEEDTRKISPIPPPITKLG